ncbi:hypothetical protein [Pseudonocardia zijingensis]|jgi:hypothetical protein|uniref:DUF5709 domain-containing protein n=1 Tax=Pseudonocardia zijingensis TaxID=153376 RepID=A0ABP3YTN3_9PSEU
MAQRDRDEEQPGRIVIADGGAALEAPDAMDGLAVGAEHGASGEEAALHVTDDPAAPGVTEPSVAGAPELDDPAPEDAVNSDPEAERAQEQAARDVAADGDVFDPGLPVLPDEPGGGPDAARVDRSPDAGGAAAGADGRQDAGPEAWG